MVAPCKRTNVSLSLSQSHVHTYTHTYTHTLFLRMVGLLVYLSICVCVCVCVRVCLREREKHVRGHAESRRVSSMVEGAADALRRIPFSSAYIPLFLSPSFSILSDVFGGGFSTVTFLRGKSVLSSAKSFSTDMRNDLLIGKTRHSISRSFHFFREISREKLTLRGFMYHRLHYSPCFFF